MVTRTLARKGAEEAEADREAVEPAFSDLSDSLLSQKNGSSGSLLRVRIDGQ